MCGNAAAVSLHRGFIYVIVLPEFLFRFFTYYSVYSRSRQAEKLCLYIFQESFNFCIDIYRRAFFHFPNLVLRRLISAPNIHQLLKLFFVTIYIYSFLYL